MFCFKRLTLELVFILIVPSCFWAVNPAVADETEEAEKPSWISLLEPVEHEEVVGKYPRIRVQFLKSIVSESLVVLLDGVDVTQLIIRSANGFEYVPPLPLSSGTHSIVLKGSVDGADQESSVEFSSRQYEHYREASTRTDLSATYEESLAESDAIGQSGYDTRTDLSLQMMNRLSRSDWQISFDTNLHYFDQQGSQKKVPVEGYDSVSLTNLALKGEYDFNRFSVQVELGDVVIDQSELTLSYLSRKGSTCAISTDLLELSLFRVRSDELYGLDGYDFVSADDNNLSGLSATMTLLEQELIVSAFFASGVQTVSAFGGHAFSFSASDTSQKGSITGVNIETDFWDALLTGEFELGLSTSDQDQNDERDPLSDQAYRVNLGTTFNQYVFDLEYEYFGPDYAVIGNPSITKDKAGFSGTGQVDLDRHAVLLSINRMKDNVANDSLFPENVTTNGSLEYTYKNIPDWPLTLTYSKAIMETKSVADSTSALGQGLSYDRVIDCYIVGLNHTVDKTIYNLSGSFSTVDDQTGLNNDSEAFTATFIPVFISKNVTFNPSLTITRAKMKAFEKSDLITLVTDTYLLNLQLGSHFWHNLVACDIGGSYVGIRTNDDSPESDGLTAQIRFALDLDHFLPGLLKPVLAVKGTYSYSKQDSAESHMDRYIPSSPLADEPELYQLYLVFGLGFPFAL
ncbi:hypothetical protein JXQ70_14805 [bacterium]|nr:hypothetical protein [bacterium]